MKRMKIYQIPKFVRDVIATGCDIQAVGRGYLIGDAELPEEIYRQVAPELRRINERYGNREHLLYHIAAYLHSIGRSYKRPAVH